MKKVIFFLILLAFTYMAFAQQYNTSDSTQERTQNTLIKKEEIWKYKGILETGYSIGLGEFGQSYFMGNFINSIAKSNYSIGIGAGLRVFGVLSTQFFLH